jgi:hypothetical protein
MMAKGITKPITLNRICNLEESFGTETDWSFGSAVAASAIAAPPAAPPPSVDLRAAWWGIGDQQQTGSCVGWASTDSVARYHFVKAGRLAKTAGLSPRFTWMASKETDTFVNRPATFIEEAGTSLKAAVDVLRKYGAAPEPFLPFHINTTMYPGKEDDFYATVATRRIASYFNLKRNVTDWRSWLATHGPILVGLTVDASWANATATGGMLNTYVPIAGAGGHAVALVGYRTDGRFIIRNSWGKTWGDKGFAYATEAYIAAGFFNESYGITL